MNEGHFPSLMKEILIAITPSAKERKAFKEATISFLRQFNNKLTSAKAILGGSGAKDTWLAGNHDVDVFVLFDYYQHAEKSAGLSTVVQPLLKKAFPGKKISRLHGSRDYFQLAYKGFTFEVIPILNIKKAEEAKNITDVSPLHSAWVNKHTKGLKHEIRLAKQFLHAHNMYGAESYIGGFSGYVVEIMIVKYGSFEQFLKAAFNWPIREIIDVVGYYRGKDVLFELNQSKLQSPLIVIDPVDKSRNAAAALAMEKFLELKNAAKAYLAAPDANFFRKKEISLAILKQRAAEMKQNMVYIPVQPLAGKRDVVGVKLLKAYELLKERLQPFVVLDAGWQFGKATFFYFFLQKMVLPAYEIHPGPPQQLKEHAKAFRKKYKDIVVEKGRLMAKVKVKHPQLADFVKALLKEKYVQERVKKIGKAIVV